MEPRIKETKGIKMHRILNTFPMSANHWFRTLPIYVKRKLGTPDFDLYASYYFTKSCYHRLIGTPKSGCSKCAGTILNTFQDIQPFVEFMKTKIQNGFNFDAISKINLKENGDLVESIFDLHLVR